MLKLFYLYLKKYLQQGQTNGNSCYLTNLKAHNFHLQADKQYIKYPVLHGFGIGRDFHIKQEMLLIARKAGVLKYRLSVSLLSILI
jgi:hypothetical protein